MNIASPLSLNVPPSGLLPPRGSVPLSFVRKSICVICVIGRVRLDGGPLLQIGTVHPRVSRLHAVIRLKRKDRSLTIEDSGSKNGTWLWREVRWERLEPRQPYPLSLGQRIALGAITGLEENPFIDLELALTFTLVSSPDGSNWQLMTP